MRLRSSILRREQRLSEPKLLSVLELIHSESSLGSGIHAIIYLYKMNIYLLAISFLMCFLSAWSLAGNVPADDARSVKAKTDSGGGGLQAFIHPDTGEILTYEQWEDLGIENEQSGGESPGGQNSLQIQGSPPALNGRLVELENGDYVIIVDAPEGAGVETRVHFDEEGKAQLRCTHKTH